MIVADRFTATVPLKYTIEPPGTQHRFITQIRWTITGSIPNKNTQNIEEIKTLQNDCSEGQHPSTKQNFLPTLPERC